MAGLASMLNLKVLSQVQRGGKLLLYTFSDENKDPWHGPSKASKVLLHERFNASSGWEVKSIESTELFSLMHGDGRPGGTGFAYLMIAERI